MTDPVSTVTIDMAEGYSMPKEYHGIDAIRSVLQRIDRLYEQCKQRDQQEANQGANTAECPDRGKFEGEIRTLVQTTDGLLTGLWSTFSSQFESKSSVISNLVKKGGDWGKIGTKLQKSQDQVAEHLRLDEWNSDGAKVFKSALPTQEKAMNELEELSYRANTVLTSAAGINAGIMEATYQSFKIIEEAVKKAANKAVVNLEYWSDSGSSDDSTGCVSFNYYQRTTTAKANFDNMKQWLDKFVTTRGEWSQSAQQVASDIPTVQASVANLKTGGGWPDPVSQTTADANVDDQSSSSGNTNSTADSSKGGGGIDLDNKGGMFG